MLDIDSEPAGLRSTCALRRLAEDSRLNAKEALAFARECAAVVTTGDTIPADVRELFVPLVVLFAQVALDRGADSLQAVVQVLRDDAAFRTLRDRAEFQELLMASEN
jgi:hypothetical protein